MASSLLVLLDDITTVLDDVAHHDQGRGQEDGRVLGDDLALNAQQVTSGTPRPRAAGGVGGGRGLAHQQGHPGAGGPGHLSPGALGRERRC